MSTNPQPEICRAHFDADCKTCSEADDELWVHPRDMGTCHNCYGWYERANSFYDEDSLCPRCGDEQDERADLGDYPPLPRNYVQCDGCGGDKTMQHHCDLTGQLRRVTALAEKWETTTELMSGQPSIVARAFASELRNALGGVE